MTKSLNYPLVGLFFAAFCLLSLSICGQTERNLISKGNTFYKENKYNEAEIAYRKSLEKKNSSLAGTFNLGDALYKQGKYEEAVSKFQEATNAKLEDAELSKAYHNLGNSLLKSKKLEESIQAYKTALKKNPLDKETKYNLSYAQTLLKEQQQQQSKENKQDKDKKNKDDKNKDQKKKEDNSENKEEGKKDPAKKDGEKDESKDQKQGDDDPSKGQKPQKGQMSEQEAQRILDALNQQEASVQKKLNKKEGQSVLIEKNW